MILQSISWFCLGLAGSLEDDEILEAADIASGGALGV
jgi:hypothetical protein